MMLLINPSSSPRLPGSPQCKPEIYFIPALFPQVLLSWVDRKFTQVALIISGKVQVGFKERLSFKCFKWYEHVSKRKKPTILRILERLGTGVFCIPEKLCAKKMH